MKQGIFSILLLVLGFLAWPLGACAGLVDSSKAVTILTSTEDDRVDVYAKNLHPFEPYHLEVGFTRKNRVRASLPMPYTTVLDPGEEVFLFDIRVLSAKKAGSYAIWSKFGPGNPDAKPDIDFAYVLPYRHGEKHLVGQGYLGRFTHKGSYSLDFDMEEGTPVCAARGGIVVETKQDSNMGGPGLEYQDHANFIRILHRDGTWASYAHLLKNGVKVRVGQEVKVGQVIGLSGNTGQTRGPHLHFAVRKARWDDGKNAIPTKFLSAAGLLVDIRESEYYFSYHPGGSPFKAILAKDIREEDLENHLVAVPANEKLEMRTEQIDNKIIFYFQNGLAWDQRVTLDFPVLKNAKISKKIPFQKKVPAQSEIYFLTLILKPGADTEYQASYFYDRIR